MTTATGFHCKVCHKFNRVLDPAPPSPASGFGSEQQTSYPCVHCGAVRYYAPEDLIDVPRGA
jgi:hypothetical protein